MQDYLIIGVPPTPNGPLHLGHISGPFLTLDIFSRCKKMLGHNTYYILGSDSFESYVLASAERETVSPEKLAEKNSRQIQQDLEALSIDLDFFIPLHFTNYKNKYFNKCYEILNNISEKKEVVHTEEYIPIDADSNKYLIGCWLSGLCPQCGSSSGSYFCEECGAHYKPEELNEHKFNRDYNVKYVQKKALFLRRTNNEIQNLIHGTYSPIKLVTSFFENKKEYTVRLTTHGEYGEKFEKYYNNLPFTYTIGLAAFYLLCSEHYLELEKKSANDIKLVTAYGFDNTAAYLTGIAPLLSLLNNPIKIDLQFINKFMLLNGSKFSTSRNHAIWVSSLLKEQDLHLEVLRVFLCKYSPTEKEENFDSALVIRDMNSFSKLWNTIFSGTTSSEKIDLTPYIKVLDQFKNYCTDSSFNHKKLVNIFINHVYSFDKDHRSISFILILLFLGRPFLPRTTKEMLNTIFNLDELTFAKLESMNLNSFFEKDVFLDQFHLPLTKDDVLTNHIGMR